MLVDDGSGVISQVSRLFSRKGYNIESIVTGQTEQPKVIRVSIEILGDELMVEQIAAQCRKLIPVRCVKIFDEETCLRRETALVKINASDRTARSEIIQLITVFRGQVVDVGKDYIIVWLFGTPDNNDSIIELLADYGILEIAKTGTVAIERGRSTIHDNNKLQEEYDYGKNVL